MKKDTQSDCGAGDKMDGYGKANGKILCWRKKNNLFLILCFSFPFVFGISLEMKWTPLLVQGSGRISNLFCMVVFVVRVIPKNMRRGCVTGIQTIGYCLHSHTLKQIDFIPFFHTLSCTRSWPYCTRTHLYVEEIRMWRICILHPFSFLILNLNKNNSHFSLLSFFLLV